MCVRPEVKVDMKQERVGKSNANNGNSVCESQQRGPSIRTEIEETVQSDNEIAGVPAAHRQRQEGQ